jgi:glutathione S-transferase
VIRLYLRPATAAMAPHAALIAAGQAPELVLVERDGERLDPPDYAELNPMGVVPTLVHDGLVLTEAAAIVGYVADTWPQAGLAPARGTRERVRFDELLAFLSTTPQQTLLRLIYPERYTTDADAKGVRAAAATALERQFGWLATLVSDRRCLLGEEPGGADFYLHMLIRWGRHLEPDTRTRDGLGPFYRRLTAHPAVAAMLEAHGIEA